MSHNNNTSDHQLNGRLQAAVRAEISGGVSGNNLHQLSLSSSLRRALFRCPHCDVIIVQYHSMPAISFQSLPLWCSNCQIFNPQWEYLGNDYRWNANQVWENWENVQFSIENQNAAPGHGWNMEDQHDNAAHRTEEDEEVDNKGRQEIIWKYLITRDCRTCENNEKKEKGEMCVICQKEFEEEEIFKRLDCGHDYHYECISQWLVLKNSCPLCIRTIIPSDFESKFDFVFNYD